MCKKHISSYLTMKEAHGRLTEGKNQERNEMRVRKGLCIICDAKKRKGKNKKLATFSLFCSVYQQLSVSVLSLFMLMKYPSPRSIVVKSLNTGGATGL